MAPPGEVDSASFNGTPALRPKPKGDSARIKVLDTRSKKNVLRIGGIPIGWIVIFGEAFQQNRRAGAATWQGRRTACARQLAGEFRFVRGLPASRVRRSGCCPHDWRGPW